MFSTFKYYLGSEDRRAGGDPLDTVFEIRKMRPDVHPYDPNTPMVWGREYYCRGTPVLFTPYEGFWDVVPDVPIMVGYVLRTIARRAWWNVLGWVGR